MKKVRLKYSIYEFNEALSEVDLHLSHQQEPARVKLTIKRRKPSAEPNEAQLNHRQQFKLAVAYAKEALANPELRTLYHEMARQAGKRAYGVAIADFLGGNNRLSKK